MINILRVIPLIVITCNLSSCDQKQEFPFPLNHADELQAFIDDQALNALYNGDIENLRKSGWVKGIQTCPVILKCNSDQARHLLYKDQCKGN